MASSRRCCVNNPNTFYHICGEYVVKKFRKPITDSVKKTYIDYFKTTGLLDQERVAFER